MGDKTKIQWCDASWNPIRGCSRVSEGCRNCYAEAVAYRFSGSGQPYDGLVVLKNNHPSWTGKVEFIEKHLLDPLRWKTPRRIFVNSMSDLFHENVTDEMRDKIFAVMALSPRHTHQVLTKRPARMLAYVQGLENNPAERLENAAYAMDIDEDYCCHIANWINGWSRWRELPDDGNPLDGTVKRWPLPNVWLGVSVENQETANERIPLLLETPAAIRFISAEPLLGGIDLGRIPARTEGEFIDSVLGVQFRPGPTIIHNFATNRIDWVICGGESGPHARPMLSSWASDIQQQCEKAGVAFFFKQNGEWVDAGHREFGRLPLVDFRYLKSDGVEWGKDVPLDENADVNTVKRVGKHRSGDTLYGKQYHEYPKVSK